MDYSYACGAVKGVESTLLDKAKLSKLFKLEDAQFKQSLADMGYGATGNTLEEIVNGEMAKVKAFFNEVVPGNPVMDLFYLQNDAQNIKVIYKSRMFNLPHNDNFVTTGAINKDLLVDAITKGNYDHIPEAYEPLLKGIAEKTKAIKNPRVLSATIDSCIFEYIMSELNTKYKDEALRTYYVNFINFANILTLVRCQSLKWPLDKFLEMYIGYGTIDKDDFIAAYALTGENLSKHFVKKEYGESIAKGLKAYDDDHNLSNLEKYLDELKLEIMKNYSLQFSSIGPLVYYYLEKQAEAKNIRLIYSDHEADTNDLLNY
ncbi:MAG: V-type ATPase subunit [Bacilli bacterium]|nr:V-type ATPase subunit [Bacilli bacterium]MDD4065626.1 V-type ATPase subunit [Bacilli bacterium]